MAGIAARCRAIAPMRAQVLMDIAAAKKGKERVVVEKTVTQCNSARVSFENRVKNGGFFANAPAARGLRGGPCVVGRVVRRLVGRPGCCACAWAGSRGGPSHRSWAAR